MIKCPNCGSTAQIRKYDWDIHFVNNDKIFIYRDYVCGCGEYFRTGKLYKADSEEEVCEEEE